MYQSSEYTSGSEYTRDMNMNVRVMNMSRVMKNPSTRVVNMPKF